MSGTAQSTGRRDHDAVYENPPAPPPTKARAPGTPDGEVEIVAGGQKVSGWTEVEIGGGLDRAPATFSLGMTERFPGQAQDLVLKPGDACEVRIGGDLVITGYINRVPRSLSATHHGIRVEGRSRCQDLVDCSALVPGMSLVNQSIGTLAPQLVAKFAGPVNVLLPDGDGDGRAYQLSITLGETPWEIISQVASYEGLLVHDDARGNLVICRVGTSKMASGFTEGVNVQSADAANDDSMIYSDYVPALFAQDTLQQFGTAGNQAGGVVKDPLVQRYRPLIVISEQNMQGIGLAQKRAVWEATRRRGRAQSVTLVCDSWRDSAGTLWTHNVLAPVHLPTLHIERQDWIIAEWAFKRDGHSGTTAHLTLMPPEAFAVQPAALTTDTGQVAQATAAAQQEASVGDGRRDKGSYAATAPNAGSGGDGRRDKGGYGI